MNLWNWFKPKPKPQPKPKYYMNLPLEFTAGTGGTGYVAKIGTSSGNYTNTIPLTTTVSPKDATKLWATLQPSQFTMGNNYVVVDTAIGTTSPFILSDDSNEIVVVRVSATQLTIRST